MPQPYVYTFSQDDLEKLDATVTLAIDSYRSGRAVDLRLGSDDHAQWLAALRNDITIRLSEV